MDVPVVGAGGFCDGATLIVIEQRHKVCGYEILVIWT